jgi:hypothetical protein
MTIEQILQALPRLSTNEINELNNRIKALNGISIKSNGIKQTQVSTGIEAWVLSLIIDQFKFMGVGFTNLTFLQKPPYYKSFCEKIPALMEYLKKSHLTKSEKSIIIREGIELLYKELIKVNKIVTERTIMLYFHRLPAVISNSYPNYAECGFLRFIINR